MNPRPFARMSNTPAHLSALLRMVKSWPYSFQTSKLREIYVCIAVCKVSYCHKYPRRSRETTKCSNRIGRLLWTVINLPFVSYTDHWMLFAIRYHKSTALKIWMCDLFQEVCSWKLQSRLMTQLLNRQTLQLSFGFHRTLASVLLFRLIAKAFLQQLSTSDNGEGQ